MGQGWVTTHVLDTGRGAPAAGMRVQLYRFGPEGPVLVRELVTNADGRTDAPVIPVGELERGVWELVFQAGEYFEATGQPGEEPRFLDVIPVRFGIERAGEHYHVPLLLSGYGYSTYRGS